MKKTLDSLSIVIVLGESLRRNSMHCYGASARNTPYIDSLIATDNIIPFSDCATSGANTIISVPRIISFYNNYMQGNWLDYPTIINAMKQAGFYTYWVSNQDRGGKYANSVTSLAQSADSTAFTHSSSYVSISNTKHNYDEEIIPLLMNTDDIKPTKKDKLFTIIHLMGQHEKFFMRYPNRFNIFKGFDNKSKTIAEYYNSILYGDWVLKQIIDKYKNRDTILFFISDHGINLFDDPNSPNSTNHAANKYATAVPFLVYMSKSFKSKYPEVYKEVLESRDKVFSSDMLAGSICNLMGINTEFNDNKFNVFSKDFVKPKYRLNVGFNNTIKIDSLYKKPDSYIHSK